MTEAEKRKMVGNYCQLTKCRDCVLKTGKWVHKTANNAGNDCIFISGADEKKLDKALDLINDAFFGVEAQNTEKVLPVRVAEGLKSAAAVIQLEVGDGSVMSVANAICKHYVQYSDTEKGLIAMDELTEHIDAYVRAERKALEYKKLAEED